MVKVFVVEPPGRKHPKVERLKERLVHRHVELVSTIGRARFILFCVGAARANLAVLDPVFNKAVIVPVKLSRNAKIPVLLTHIIGLDLSDPKAFEVEMERLIKSISKAPKKVSRRLT